MTEIDEHTFKECINQVASTEEGQIVLFWLMSALGWEDIHVSLENDRVNVYDMTRRNVWGGLRRYINKDYLKAIEFNFKRKAAKNERRKSTVKSRKPTDDNPDNQ